MSLAGQWELTPEDAAKEWPKVVFPLSLMLRGSETLQITYVASPGFEQVSFLQRDMGTRKMLRTDVQRGKLNFTKKKLLSMVISSDRQFTEFFILHLGPQGGQRLYERFTMSENKMEMTLYITIEIPATSEEGAQNWTFTKSFRRCTRLEERQGEFKPIFPMNIINCMSSRHDSCIECIQACGVVIADTLEITLNKSAGQLLEGTGTITHGFENGVDKEGGLATFFVIKVSRNSKTWKVYRRYREFNALKHFVALHIKDSKALPPFPPKTNGKVSGKGLIKRSAALNAYIGALVSTGALMVPNLIDALLSFLEVPHHLLSGTQQVSATGTAYEDRGPSSFLTSDALTMRQDPSAPISGLDRFSYATADTDLNSSYLTGGTDQGVGRNGGGSIRSSLMSSGGSRFPVRTAWDERSQMSETTRDWHSVVSEVSAPDTGKLGVGSQAGRQRLLEGVVVIKHGRQGSPKSRLLRLDVRMDRLYWLDVANINKSVNDVSKSVNLKEVLKLQPGVKYVRGVSGGKECVSNGSPTLTKACSLDDLKKCLTLVLAHRTFDIQCITQEDYNDIYSALLSLTDF